MSHLAWLKDYKIPKMRRLKSIIVQVAKRTAPTSKAAHSSTVPKSIRNSKPAGEVMVPLQSTKSTSTQTEDPEDSDNLEENIMDDSIVVTAQVDKKKKRKKCFKCGRWGHERPQCTNPKKIKKNKEIQSGIVLQRQIKGKKQRKDIKLSTEKNLRSLPPARGWKRRK